MTEFFAKNRLFGDVCSLFGGLLLPLGFSPFDVWLTPFISLVVLCLTWSNVTSIRAFWRGWLFGCGMYGLGVSWVVESFQYSYVSFGPAVLLTILLVMFLALFPAVLGAFLVFSGATNVYLKWVVVMPAAWVLIDFFRASFLSGFTWLQVGYSQIDTPLSGLAPIGGVYAMSWVVAVTSGYLVWLLLKPKSLFWRASILVLIPWLLAIWANSITWTTRAGPDISIALLQGNIPQDIKWQAESKVPTLHLYHAMTRAHLGNDLIIWPETAIPGFYEAFRTFLSELQHDAISSQTDLLIGVPTKKTQPVRFHNSLVVVGAEPSFYHKRHLVPFGEYLPLEPILRPIARAFGLPIPQFNPGPEDSRLLRVAGYPVGVSICYEATFGKDVIRALPEAAFLVNVSNDAWFGESIAPHQHLQMARLRAREAGRYLARGTNTGISAFISPRGDVVARAPQAVRTTLVMDITPLQGVTPYSRWIDYPVLVLMLILLVFGTTVGRVSR